MLPKNVLYYGKNEPLPDAVPLRAGPLSLIFEAGDLRQIRLGAREVLQRVYVAVRDPHWDTIPLILHDLKIDGQADSFSITFEAEHRRDPIHFRWRGTISGAADGTISYRMEGEALATFERNRIGICVLHPASLAGEPCTITHTDGTTEAVQFPRYIAPHQPFLNLGAITHEAAPGVMAEVRFSGDVFETEDQRNWSDGSFKTYSTPLELPRPVEVAAGTKIEQAITLHLTGDTSTAPVRAAAPTVITVSKVGSIRLPRIGVALGEPPNTRQVARLRALNLAHLRIDVDLTGPDYTALLRRADHESDLLSLPLEIALYVDGESDTVAAQLAAFAPHLKDLSIARLLIFHKSEEATSARWLQLTHEHFGTLPVPFGGGAYTNFTELNRNRPTDLGAYDFFTFPLAPQVHAFDNRSLVENLGGQTPTLESARLFCGDKPLHIGALNLKPQPAPHERSRDSLPSEADARQMSLFGAAWTVGSLAAISGAEAVTCYATVGPLGVMERAEGTSGFPALPSSVYPLYHMLADVGEFAGGDYLPVIGADPLLVAALAMRKGDRARLLLANLTGDPQDVTLQNLPGAFLRMLDAGVASKAMTEPETFRAGQTVPVGSSLTLPPYAIARLDFRVG